MSHKDSPFWIDIDFENEDTATEKLGKAISRCLQVHLWIVSQLNTYWVENLTLPRYQDFRYVLLKYIYEMGMLKHTQKYSLIRAGEQTFPYVSSQTKIGEDKKTILATPIDWKEYKKIQIQSRRVWKRYLAKGYGITTTYGTILPIGEWKETLREQAGEIPLDLFPYLWHSIIVWNDPSGWKMKFNFHQPNSKQGKKAQKELEEEYA